MLLSYVWRQCMHFPVNCCINWKIIPLFWIWKIIVSTPFLNTMLYNSFIYLLYILSQFLHFHNFIFEYYLFNSFVVMEYFILKWAVQEYLNYVTQIIKIISAPEQLSWPVLIKRFFVQYYLFSNKLIIYFATWIRLFPYWTII